MSELKLYAVKNDGGKYLLDSSLSMDYPEWTSDLDGTEIFVERHNAVTASNSSGGHVVTFVEEPKKVVISEEQAKIVEKARVSDIPATCICYDSGDFDEKLLISALVNGYTVSKEKKYNVKVPHADDSYFYKIDHETCNATDSFHIDLDRPEAKFTKLEIDHYHLQEYKKEEVTDDDE